MSKADLITRCVVNRWSGPCAVCDCNVGPKSGWAAYEQGKQGKWRVYCAAHQPTVHQAAPAPDDTPAPAPAPVSQSPTSIDMVALLAEVRKAARREAATEAAAQFATWENSQEQPAPLEIVVKHSDRDPVRLDGPFHPMLPTVITMLGAKSHVYLVGPAGCGKTTIAEQAAKALGIEFRFTGAVGSPYELVGYRDANGHVIRTQFRDAYEHGGLFLFDEVDASDARALLRFNAALANGWSDFPDGKIARHPDFRCIAAANTFGNGADRQYVGRAQLDAATLDRFAFLPMDYDETLEKSIGDAAWCQYIHKVRRIVRDLKLRHVVSTRAVIMGSALLGAGVERATVEAAVLWKGLDADGIAKVRTAL